LPKEFGAKYVIGLFDQTQVWNNIISDLCNEKPRHKANNCYQNKHDAQNVKFQQGNYASTNNQGDEQLFVM
jgi:hypothetical protein